MELPHVDTLTIMLIGAAMLAIMMLLPTFLIAYAFLQKFATKSDLDAVEKRAKHDQTTSEARITVQLGQIETRLTHETTDNRVNADKHFESLAGKMDTLTHTMQLYVNDTSRAVGVLEGKITALALPSK